MSVFVNLYSKTAHDHCQCFASNFSMTEGDYERGEYFIGHGLVAVQRYLTAMRSVVDAYLSVGTAQLSKKLFSGDARRKETIDRFS